MAVDKGREYITVIVGYLYAGKKKVLKWQ